MQLFNFDKKEKIKKYLRDLGAQSVPHTKGATLYDHLVRVGELLSGWNLSSNVVYAGMCHSLYSTDVFKTALLSIDKRSELKDLIGSEAELLVYTFCSVDRSTIAKHDAGFYFSNRITQEKINISENEGINILHILVANDIDHLTIFNVTSESARFGKYLKWLPYLSEPVQDYLNKLAVDQTVQNSKEEYVRFIAHSGLQVITPQARLVIDPWLYPSSREQPKVQGLDPSSYTIDYLIPEPKNILSDIASDIILLSHFHTHHSPFLEIKGLAEMNPVHIVCPPLDDNKLKRLEETLGPKVYENIQFHFITQDSQLELQGITIKCLTHSHPNHLAFFVTTNKLKVLHIADAAASADSASLQFDSFWEKFYNLKPDYFFVGAAGHSVRQINSKGERAIKENTTLTPVQAAKLTCKVDAKHVGIIGVYNFSVWDSRIEYSRSYEAAESEFYWAMSFLAPSVQVHQFRPGDIFNV